MSLFPLNPLLELWVEESLVKRGALHIQHVSIPRHPLSSWQIFLPGFAGSCLACWGVSVGLPTLVQKSLTDHLEQSSQAAALTGEQNPAKVSLCRQDTYSVCIKQTCSADRLKQACLGKGMCCNVTCTADSPSPSAQHVGRYRARNFPTWEAGSITVSHKAMWPGWKRRSLKVQLI